MNVLLPSSVLVSFNGQMGQSKDEGFPREREEELCVGRGV